MSTLHYIDVHKEAVVQSCSVKKDVLRNLAKFTGQHLCQSLFLIKLQVSARNFIKRLWRRCCPVNFAEFLSTPSFKKHLRWLLLSMWVGRKFLLNFDQSFKIRLKIFKPI